VPWRESLAVDQRREFVEEWLRRRVPLKELCARFAVSRKTGYKWLARFYQEGVGGLVDRSRAPRQRPQAVSEEIAESVVQLRKKHAFWGPKKLRAWLEQRRPDVKWPALSTIAELLKKRGLVPERKRRQRAPVATQPLAAATEPNVVWSGDYKGCFRVAGRWCHPLTITDNSSRYLLRVEVTNGTGEEEARRVFESAFREFGLPWRIRTDNGSPFASRGIGGLTRLSVWWVKLGITPERIQPGHPQENGRHERMHRTLKAEAATPARPSAEEQQRAFDEFRKYFNEERPHEALEQRTPASWYQPSTRSMPTALSEPDYPEDFMLRRIPPNGRISLGSGMLGLGSVLGGEVVGIEEIADDIWQLWFGPIYLGLVRKEAKGVITLVKNNG
jgi:transposase InsO family protein